jgi:hypothetical protein
VTFTNNSKVTLTDLQNYITDSDDFINSKIKRVYQVPITDIEDVNILKYISARLTATEVAQVLVLQASRQIPPTVKIWCDSALERLDRILDSTIDLPNSSKVISNKGLYSYTADSNNDCTPMWTLKGDEW